MLFPDLDSDALYFSMFDSAFAWSRDREHPFKLEGQQWQSTEHYYQAMKFNAGSYQEKIRAAETIEQARKLGKARFKRKRTDWPKVRTTVMTRAIYTVARTYSNVAEELLATKDTKLVENSQYDYFWGCGRDRRGENHFGKVLMGIRAKLLDEAI